jgi:hypothetical protein
MDVEMTLTEMEQLLEDEQTAIRQIDVDGLDQFADRKLALMQSLTDNGLTGRSDLAERFGALVTQLRDNGVLLAHARNCVRDVIQVVAAPASLYDTTGKSSAPPKTVGGLSVTG